MKWIPIHELLNVIGPARTSGIMNFHAFTVCDVVSGGRGKGKKSAWQTWDVFDEVMETFSKLSHFPTEVTDADLKTVERFVVLMYIRSSAATGVDEARLQHMLARNQRPHDSILPTQAALREHAKRAAYQAGVIWGQATAHRTKLPGTDQMFVQERCKCLRSELARKHSATARINIRTVRKTTVFQLVQYMCSKGQLTNVLYRFARGCWQQFDSSHKLFKLLFKTLSYFYFVLLMENIDTDAHTD